MAVFHPLVCKNVDHLAKPQVITTVKEIVDIILTDPKDPAVTLDASQNMSARKQEIQRIGAIAGYSQNW